MLLRAGDVGDAVKALQRGLNKLGSMLLIDGHFGPGTQDAVSSGRVALGRPGPSSEADDELQQALAALADLFPPVTAAGSTFIARAEVGSAVRYRQKYQGPTWPSATSGITIGVGYDLQFVTPTQIRADWSSFLPAQTVDRLVGVCGVVGSDDRLAQVRDVMVPLAAAVSVFAQRTLPKVLDQTRGIYPQIDTLTPPRRTSLVSLVYNRGPSLKDRDPAIQDRREMREIRDLLAAGQLDAIADQFDAMSRLWNPQKLAGLVQRRHDEATLWRSGFAALLLD